ncbi:MAG: L-rhamnose mutarotase [Desulfobacteraceae bacterium]|nr:L-rhamnose mutarotase [Desulfobacteraceae bacterium]
MLRNTFVMTLKPGYKDEYKKQHDSLWSQLEKELKAAGILDYSICLQEETGALFAYQELSESHTVDDLPQKEIVKKWWSFMSDIMETNADNSPKVTKLEEVFFT